ncbi:MAG: DUF2169 domain-containing protein [Gammaproteobacteria bacterium]|nr:DUF2169 domain-containing protein [Gammaproteobacteria bacterium]
MLEIKNYTKYKAELYPGYNQNNEHQLTCVIKAGYNFTDNGELIPLDLPLPIVVADKFADETNRSNLLAASEIVPYKHKPELLLYGAAQIPKPELANTIAEDSTAPKDQQIEQPFQSEATLTIPKNKPKLVLALNNVAIPSQLTPICDTVVIDSDKQILHLIWRTGIAWQIDDSRDGKLIIKDDLA